MSQEEDEMLDLLEGEIELDKHNTQRKQQIE
jgi:hypothetical protein